MQITAIGGQPHINPLMIAETHFWQQKIDKVNSRSYGTHANKLWNQHHTDHDRSHTIYAYRYARKDQFCKESESRSSFSNYQVGHLVYSTRTGDGIRQLTTKITEKKGQNNCVKWILNILMSSIISVSTIYFITMDMWMQSLVIIPLIHALVQTKPSRCRHRINNDQIRLDTNSTIM